MTDQKKEGLEWKGFANIRLEKQDKKAIRVLAENMSGQDAWDYILSCIDGGYKVSVSPDYEHDAVIVSLTGQGWEDGYNPNAGYVMSQRHSDPMVALAASKFAHEEIAERGSWIGHQYDWRETDW